MVILSKLVHHLAVLVNMNQSHVPVLLIECVQIVEMVVQGKVIFICVVIFN